MNFLIPVCWAALIFIITFAILKRKQPRVNHLKSLEFWLWWVVMTPITFVIAFLIFVAVLTYTPSNDFTTEAWLADPSKRTELIDDLVDSKQLDGLTSEEVIALLGEAEKTAKMFFADRKWDAIYNLGTERGLIRIDCEWLLIWFEDNRVTKYEVRAD